MEVQVETNNWITEHSGLNKINKMTPLNKRNIDYIRNNIKQQDHEMASWWWQIDAMELVYHLPTLFWK